MSYSAVCVAALSLARGAEVTVPILTHDTRSRLTERPEKLALHHSQHGPRDRPSRPAAIALTAGQDRARGAAVSAGRPTPPPRPRPGARPRPRASRHRPGS